MAKVDVEAEAEVKVGDHRMIPGGGEGWVVWVSGDGRAYALKAVKPVRRKRVVYLMGAEK